MTIEQSQIITLGIGLLLLGPFTVASLVGCILNMVCK